MPGTRRPLRAEADRAHQAEPAPTALARLTIKVGPEQRWGGAAEGIVPADQAHLLITTFGVLGSGFSILGSACAGLSGAVLVLRSAGPVSLAYAALAVGLTAAALIAACSLARVRQEGRAKRARPDELAGPDDSDRGQRTRASARGWIRRT